MTGRSSIERLIGQARTCENISFINFQCSSSSHPPSNTQMPRLPRRQLPVIFSSSIVWMFCTWNFPLGPFGVRDIHKYRSSCRRVSK